MRVLCGSLAVFAVGCMLPMEDAMTPEAVWAYRVEKKERIEGSGEYASEDWIVVELQDGKPIWPSSGVHHHAPLSSLSFSDAAHFLFPEVEAWAAGRVVRRSWVLDGSYVLGSAGHTAPSIHEAIHVESCRSGVCEVRWERTGRVELGMTVQLWQRGTGAFDVRRGRYRSVELRTWRGFSDEERTSILRLEYDPGEAARRQDSIDELVDRARRGAATYDAWVANHPGPEEARAVFESSVAAFDRAIRRTGCMAGFDRPWSPVAFYAVSQPRAVWETLVDLPPSAGRQWGMSRVASSQRRAGVEPGLEVTAIVAGHVRLVNEIEAGTLQVDEIPASWNEEWAIDALWSGHVGNSIDAASYLARRPPSDEAADALVFALDAPDPRVRLEAARALYRWRDPRGLQAMVALLRPWRPDVPPESVLAELAGELPTMLGFESADDEGREAEAIGRLREWARRELERTGPALPDDGGA